MATHKFKIIIFDREREKVTVLDQRCFLSRGKSLYQHTAPAEAFHKPRLRAEQASALQSVCTTSVNHALLLYTLEKSYHLSGVALGWFRSYLCGREQCVVLNGKRSDWAHVRSGVPEGSICGPILFVLFCNDVPSQISSTCLLYADYIKLYRRIRSPGDAVLLQTDLERLCLWSAAWKLSLNPSKCKTIKYIYFPYKHIESSYSINSISLEHVTEMRDLGILFDSKLAFGPHQRY